MWRSSHSREERGLGGSQSGQKNGVFRFGGNNHQDATVARPLRGDDLWAELHFSPRSFEPSLSVALTISWAFLACHAC